MLLRRACHVRALAAAAEPRRSRHKEIIAVSLPVPAPGRARHRRPLPNRQMVGTLTRVSEPFLVRPGSGRVLDMGNFAATVLADGAATSGAFALLETHGEGHGFGPPMHVHRDAAEAFYVLEGTYQMFFESRYELAPAGTFVYVPQHAPHTFKLISEGFGRKLNIFSPAAMVGFFEQLSAAEASGDATLELLAQIAERHEMEIVGPVPDGYL